MREPLEVVYAGSLEGLLVDLAPAFEELTGYRCRGRSGGSRAWAQKLRAGEARADVFLSADAQVNEIELMGEANGRVVEWYLTFAANEMVLAYTPQSPGVERVAAARATRNPLLEVLRAGLRLCRTDPEADPKGYRAIQAMELLSRFLGVPELVRQVLGEPGNPAQMIAPAEMMGAIARGEYDLGLTYRSQAVEADLPFVALPDATNLGAPECAELYAEVEYRCGDGAVYPGALISYTAAIPSHAEHPLAAAAFLAFLASGPAGAWYEKHGFRRIAPTLHGTERT